MSAHSDSFKTVKFLFAQSPEIPMAIRFPAGALTPGWFPLLSLCFILSTLEPPCLGVLGALQYGHHIEAEHCSYLENTLCETKHCIWC